MTDQTIPADKVQEIIDMMDTRPTHPDGTSHHSEGYNEAVCLWNKHLRALLPKPRTLADELREYADADYIPHYRMQIIESIADRVETLEQERDEARELLGLREALIAEMKEESEQDRVSSTAEIARLHAREIPDGWRIAEHPQFGTVIASADLDGMRGPHPFHHCVYRSNVGPGISQTWASTKELKFWDEAPAPEQEMDAR